MTRSGGSIIDKEKVKPMKSKEKDFNLFKTRIEKEFFQHPVI